MTVPVTREASIDLGAVSENVRRVLAVTGTAVIAVVKANAYGHGARAVAEAALAGGASRIGVATLDEAVSLRREGLAAPLLAWLHGPGQRFDEAAHLDIEVGVSSFDQLDAVAVAAGDAGRTVGVHLKFDSGLSRNGCAPTSWPRLCAEAARLERIGRVRVVGLFSHLSGTSIDEDRAQLERFLDAVAVADEAGVRPELRHVAATAAALSLPEARLDAVRIGLGLYGLSPFDDQSSADVGLRPVMTLRGGVAAVRRVPASTGVSYGFDYRTSRETTLVLVPLGYADGVPRQASGRGPVWINGQKFTVAGRIAMDQFVVDVGDLAVSVGDEVVLFGDPQRGYPAVEEWARAADTINYEIVTRIGARVPRVACGEGGV